MSTIIQIDKKILKEIESGKYRNDYLIPTRKSTDDLDNQKNSTAFQGKENRRYAIREHLPIAPLTVEGFCRDGIITELHSAFKEDDVMILNDNSVQFNIERPKFFLLVQWLNKGYFKGAIFYCWDRASRNKADDMILRRLIKKGVDIRFVIAKYEKSSSGELYMDVEGMFSQHHSRVTSEKVSLTIRNKRNQGYVTNKAGVGYQNNGQMEHKPLDTTRSHIILRLYELYDTGEWSLAGLARWAAEQGFTMPPMRRRRTKEEILSEDAEEIHSKIQPICRPPTYNNIHKILTNRFYTGRTLDANGQWIKSNSHVAIVSDELFERVQIQLHKHNRSSHYTDVLDQPLRGLIRCAMSKRLFTPYPKKGITYLYAGCDEHCTNKNHHFNFDYISEKIGQLIKNLSFTDAELDYLNTRTGTEIALLETKRHSRLDEVEREKKKIREDLAYMNENRLTLLKTGVYTPETMVAADLQLNSKLKALQEEESTSDAAMAETMKEIVRLSELLKDLYVTYENAKPREKEEIIKELFSELYVNENTLEYQCVRGFQPLANRFVSDSDPTGSRTRV